MIQAVSTNPFKKTVVQAKLRKCQQKAYAAIREHYAKANSERRVLIQLPTGTGKSVLVAIAPFELSSGKVLVVTPNLKLVKQISDDLDLQLTSNKYEELELFSKPDISDLKSSLFLLILDDKANSGDVIDNQVVVANFQQLFDLNKWFAECKDAVDMVVIDEAHHQAADTYKAVIDYFPEAKIVGLTGTPFRTDGKKVEGERIYKYTYEEAITDSVIRNFSHHDVTPQEVHLVFKDDNKKQYTLSEILKLSEESWFQNKVSMSDDCCDSIAVKAKEKLDELRKAFQNEHHQIIASAMTIRHAREQVKNAFEKLGLSVGLVSSDKEDLPKNAAVLDKLKKNQLDVIINVGMLGEGFDHKPLGVAAIFRPYKSLNPYIQFVGRVIRKNGGTDRAYIVSHAGLNQVSRFKEFRLFDQDEQAFLQTRLFSEPVADEKPDNAGEMFVRERGSESNEFLDSKLLEVGSQLIETQHNFVNKEKVGSLLERIKDLTPEEKELLASLLAEQDPDLVGSFQKSAPHPTAKRKASRAHLNERAKSITIDVARALGITQPMKTRTFNPLYNDYRWITQRVNKKIKEFSTQVGVPEQRAGKRRDLRNDDYQAIDENTVLEKAKTDCIAHFQKSLGKKKGK
ncbi:MAG: DEAD/DEAH box helicase family protein [Candidatus Obscuribacterales bacterium]|nr:DEAD/DEAH box helicase family protein [Candidatus Obscuribacterales bacterium]